MASIKGIQLKALRTFMAHEGCGFTANIYIDNKKAGEITDPADGSGMFEIYISDKNMRAKIADRAKEYYNENPAYFLYYKPGSIEESREEGLISEITEELVALNEVEKSFKKFSKKGYPITVRVDFNERTKDIMDADYNFANMKIVGVVKWDAKYEKVLKTQNPQAKVFTAYQKLEDFIIK